MSETNGCPYQTVRVSTKVRFEFDDGRKIDLPVGDTIREWRQLADELTKASGTHDDYLRKIIERIQANHGVMLTMGEADELNSSLVLADAKKKAYAAQSMRDTLTLLSPTQASTSSG